MHEMDRFIRHKENKTYLTASGEWTSDRSLALTFYFADDARAYCLERGIRQGVEGVVFYGTLENAFELFGR